MVQVGLSCNRPGSIKGANIAQFHMICTPQRGDAEDLLARVTGGHLCHIILATQFHAIRAAEEIPVVGAVSNDDKIGIKIQIFLIEIGREEAAADGLVAIIRIEKHTQTACIGAIGGSSAHALGDGIAVEKDLFLIGAGSDACTVGQFHLVDMAIVMEGEQNSHPMLALRQAVTHPTPFAIVAVTIGTQLQNVIHQDVEAARCAGQHGKLRRIRIKIETDACAMAGTIAKIATQLIPVLRSFLREAAKIEAVFFLFRMVITNGNGFDLLICKLHNRFLPIFSFYYTAAGKIIKQKDRLAAIFSN